MSNIEHELRILDIDKAAVISTLEALGAIKVGEFSYRRHVFEVIPSTKGRWVRLRTDGTTTTLTIKQIVSDKVDGTSEWETKVDDFDTTFVMLQKIGLTSKGYQENMRIMYSLDDADVCIDTWPKIPTYLEIEAKSAAIIHDVTSKLGFSKKNLTGINVEKIYLLHGIDITKKANLSF